MAIANPNVVSASLAIFLNKGDGTFQMPVNYVPDVGVEYVVTGDLNGDGALDLFLITANLFSNVASVLGNGDGTFQVTPHYASGKLPQSAAIYGRFQRRRHSRPGHRQ